MSGSLSASSLLSVKGITVRFGGLVALEGVSFDVAKGQICGLIGPNGSGKTTLFNCISGIYAFKAGDILFEGQTLTRLSRHKIITLGIGRTFQNLALFPTLSVRENVLVGAQCLGRSGFLSSALRLPFVRAEEEGINQRVTEFIEFLDLQDVADAEVSSLPFGTQKRVELARALVSRPTLLLLDEPAGGLNHGEVDQLANLISSVRDRFGCSILLVEHHMNMVMRISDKVVALELGRKIADGTPAQVQAHPDVVRAYLGDD